MLNTILNWHPRFNVYRHGDKGVLLVAEEQSLWLANTAFADLTTFDGKKNCQQIRAMFINRDHKALFKRQIEKLIAANLLISIENKIFAHYIDSPSTSLRTFFSDSLIDVFSLSGASQSNLESWTNLIRAAQPKDRNIKSIKISYCLVDDYLDVRLIETLNPFQYYCVIKITGEKLWLSPIFENQKFIAKSQYSRLNFSLLQRRLWDNQPVRKLVRQLFSEQTTLLPFLKNEQLSSENQQLIRKLLYEQIFKSSNTLSIVVRTDNRLSQHRINLLDTHPDDFAKQIDQPIVLVNCTSLFNDDGGSRHLDPAQTVAQLLKFVDPITGIIANFSLQDYSGSEPMPLYQTRYFKTPMLEQNDALDIDQFIQVCMGKGVSDLQSQASALCEAIERHAALYQGDEPLLRSNESDLHRRSYNFQQLTPLSTAQYANFTDPDHNETKYAVKPYHGSEIHWIPSWSLSKNEQVLVPLSCCFSNIPFDDTMYGRWHSNGCAAGNTLEEAILQAMYELIERDASAIWWYNQIERPAFELNILSSDKLTRLHQALSASHNYWVLNITADIGIPVMVAIAQDKLTGAYTFGFGCHLLPVMAAQRALTELCQLLPIREQHSAPFDFNAIKDECYLHPQKKSKASAIRLVPSSDIKHDILNIVALLQKTVGCETLVINYSRQQTPIKTAKVFTPGLCHIWPQLANARLYHVPVKLGWRDHANCEASINPQSLLI